MPKIKLAVQRLNVLYRPVAVNSNVRKLSRATS